MKLSILMPVYNEKPWVGLIIEKVLRQAIPGISSVELIVVDDGSTDGTKEVIEDLARRHLGRLRPIFHEKNGGKGAAIRSALSAMTGDVCIIQDGDMEYDPADYPGVLAPIIDGRADCVYGSRFIGSQPKRVLLFWHYVGNKIVTLFSNIATDLNLTDIETGCKAFRSEILKGLSIVSNDFGFEPEITAKVARRRCRIYEVGINYNGRTYAEGKKITWVDGLKAVVTIFRFWLIRD
jgi:glycosyltransferase involved in cell wall biosynthesis